MSAYGMNRKVSHLVLPTLKVNVNLLLTFFFASSSARIIHNERGIKIHAIGPRIGIQYPLHSGAAHFSQWLLNEGYRRFKDVIRLSMVGTHHADIHRNLDVVVSQYTPRCHRNAMCKQT